MTKRKRKPILPDPPKRKRKPTFRFDDEYHKILREHNRRWYWAHKDICDITNRLGVTIRQARKILEAQKKNE